MADSHLVRLVPRPRLGKPGLWRPVRRVVVFARLPSPTLDYFLIRRLTVPGRPPLEIVDLATDELPSCELEGTFVVFCRYANPASLRWVGLNRDRLAGVGLMIDDDLAAWVTARRTPLGYRLFLLQNGVLPLLRLNSWLSHLWVGTSALAAAIGEAGAVPLLPAPRREDFTPAHPSHSSHPDGPVRIVFFAEYHDREHDFLLPVIARVLQERPQVQIEVTGTPAHASRWRSIAGVEISPFRPWPEFRAYTASHPADLVLAPLLADAINATRSATKRIDVARMNAAGVYSSGSVFEATGTEDELFIPNDEAAWVAHLIRLIDDPVAREKARQATRQVVEDWHARETGLPGLF